MLPMPARLTEVGAHERGDHYHLPADAKCYFWGEYTPYENTNGLKWNFSSTNQLMSNFKKGLDRRGFNDWGYKNQAIQTIATAFSKFWKWPELRARVALIPVPPSKARGDATYDPRMVEMLNGIAARSGGPLDIRDCLSFSGKFGASHKLTERPSPDELYAELSFDDAVGRPHQRPEAIFIFDYMLTTGAHHVAVTRKLAEKFAGVPVVAQFVARRAVPNPFAEFGAIEND